MHHYAKQDALGVVNRHAGSANQFGINRPSDAELTAIGLNAIACLTTIPPETIQVKVPNGFVHLPGGEAPGFEQSKKIPPTYFLLT
jgi:hypothetical protein